MSLESVYGQVLNEHNLHPFHKGETEGATLMLEGKNPTCGDDIFLQLKVSPDGIIEDGSFVYFVHSYYLDADDKDIVKATIDYGVRVDAAVEAGNVFACQFHPEKSSSDGLSILENFINVR